MANIIYKGIKAPITAKGTGIVSGTSYTAVLYYSPSSDDNRISQTATATTVGGEAQCVFNFTDDQTKELKTGSVILDLYDANKNRIKLIKNYATVEPTSLSD